MLWIDLFVCLQTLIYSCLSAVSLIRNCFGGFPTGFFSLMNKNPLSTFLFANILTGVVNMSVQTLLLGPFLSTMIVLGYIFVVGTFSYLAGNISAH